MPLAVTRVRRRYPKPVQFLVDWGCIAVLLSVLLPVLSLVIFLVFPADGVLYPFTLASSVLTAVFGNAFSDVSRVYRGYLSIAVVATGIALPVAVAYCRFRYSRVVVR